MSAVAVPLHHPSPVVHIPPRRRTPQAGYERILTPVAIVRVDPTLLVPRPGAGLPCRWLDLRDLVVHEGRLWRPLRLRESGAWRAAGPRDLAEAACDDAGEAPRAWFAAAFSGTPLLARREADPVHGGRVLTLRGEPVEAGRVVAREAERSAAVLADWVGANLRLAGTGLLMRADPLAIPAGDAWTLGIETRPRLSLDAPPACPFRIERARAEAGQCPLVPTLLRERDAHLSPDLLDPDADLALLANRAPALARHLLERHARRAGRRPGPGEREALARLDALAPAGERGTVGDPGCPISASDALAATAEAIELVLGACPEGPYARAPRLLGRHIRDVALPRLDPPAADAAALAWLGPS